MLQSGVRESTAQIIEAPEYLTVERITALWALSEAALGGVLHALHFPLTGLLINSASVIYIVLIAFYSRQAGAILRATMVVLIVKGIVSPHTPLTAYLAVFVQGV